MAGAYYRLYQESPAAAERALIKAHTELDGSIRATAKKLGCSRNTVRAVLRRLKRYTRQPNPRLLPSRKPRRRPEAKRSLTVVPASLWPRLKMTARAIEETGVLLLRS